MTRDPTRWGALVLGGAILAWQAVNAARGRFVHDFLVPDLVVAALLVATSLRAGRRVQAARLAAFAATAGVFLCATTAGLAAGSYDLGRALTSLGLIPCLAGVAGLLRRLTAPEQPSGRDRP